MLTQCSEVIYKDKNSSSGKKENRALKIKLVNSGMKLIQELQILFSTMAVGKKKYLDPSGVLESVLDD